MNIQSQDVSLNNFKIDAGLQFVDIFVIEEQLKLLVVGNRDLYLLFTKTGDICSSFNGQLGGNVLCDEVLLVISD